MELNRRRVLSLGGAAAAAAAVGRAGVAPAAPAGLDCVAPLYAAQKAKAGGHWHSYVTAVDGGRTRELVVDDIDYVIEGASVQKLAVALAVLDKVDRGELSLAQK